MRRSFLSICSFARSVQSLVMDLLWFIVLYAFGWTYEKYKEMNKVYVAQKQNVQDVFRRKIYKEQDFIFT